MCICDIYIHNTKGLYSQVIVVLGTKKAYWISNGKVINESSRADILKAICRFPALYVKVSQKNSLSNYIC